MPRSQHRHEFPGEEIEAEFDGRYVYVYEYCEHAPLLHSVTDHQNDRTFDVHGDSCEAQRTTNVIVSNPEESETGTEITYDDYLDLWNGIMNENADTLKKAAKREFGKEEPEEGITVTVEYATAEYDIGLELDDREVSE